MDSPALRRHFNARIAAVRASAIHRATARRGLSLIELLASLVITLIVMGATVQLFGTVSNAINFGRAGLETNDRIRTAVQPLRTDLRGLTCDTIPWQRPENASGYLEILKGPGRDSIPGAANTLVGYWQDMIFLTSRSKDVPFKGRYNGQSAESQVAEIVWFMSPSLNSAGQTLTPPSYTLYRRVLLVRPDLGSVTMTPSAFFDTYDISAHSDGSGHMIANSLADLCYRENRFGHLTTPAPFLIQAASVVPFPPGDVRYGEDVVLTNVLSFDIKVWDPQVELRYDSHATTTVPGTPLVPSDPGWATGSSFTPKIFGAYVDLNYLGAGFANSTYFSGPYMGPNQTGLFGSGQSSGLAASASTSNYATYDLWPAGYEYYTTGVAANSNGQSNNGFDDFGTGVDNPTEHLTSPPYPVPLRGVQFKIRVYETTTQQVREVTIAETFLPD